MTRIVHQAEQPVRGPHDVANIRAHERIPKVCDTVVYNRMHVGLLACPAVVRAVKADPGTPTPDLLLSVFGPDPVRPVEWLDRWVAYGPGVIGGWEWPS